MSMPIEKFVLSLELSAKNLHDTIAQWTSFDAELRENYRDNIEWLVERAQARMVEAGTGPFSQRLADAYACFVGRRADLSRVLGVDLPREGGGCTVVRLEVRRDNIDLPLVA